MEIISNRDRQFIVVTNQMKKKGICELKKNCLPSDLRAQCTAIYAKDVFARSANVGPQNSIKHYRGHIEQNGQDVCDKTTTIR